MRASSGCGVLLFALLTACVDFRSRHPDGAPADAGVTEAAFARLPPDWHVLGLSVQGRSIRAATVGRGPRRVLWIGGIHGDEREGRVATAELPAALQAIPGALDEVTLTIVEDLNPDGTALGVRGNANGVDLNRNFPAANFRRAREHGAAPLSEPEAKVLHDLVQAGKPHLVLVAHGWRGDRFVNYDGPAGALAERFRRLSSYPLRESAAIPATPGSLGSWIGRALGIPILTLEYRRGADPARAWDETRVAILAVILG